MITGGYERQMATVTRISKSCYRSTMRGTGVYTISISADSHRHFRYKPANALPDSGSFARTVGDGDRS
jgi:hypothetical protein